MGRKRKKQFKLPKKGIKFGYSQKARETLKWLKDTAYQFESYTILPDENSD